MEIFCCKACLRMQYNIKIGLRHRQILVIILTARNLMDCLHSCLSQQIIQFTVIHKRREKSQKIHHISLFLFRLKKRIQRLTHMHHRGFSSLSCQCIHIAWPYRKTNLFRRFSTDALHIRSQKRIHAGNTDHHNGWFLFHTLTDFFDCLWNLLQMTSRHDIRLVHHQIKKTIMIFPHRANHRCISSTAPRCHNEHNRARHCKTGTFYTKPLCSRRIKRQRCR